MPPSITPPRRSALLGLLTLAAAAVGAPDADAASRLLWTNFSANTISQAGLDGAGVAPFAGGASSPSAIVVRGRYVYWTNGTGGGTIGRAGLDGTGVNQGFVTGLGGSPFGLAVTDSHIYWTLPLINRVGRANLDGTGVVQQFLGTSAGLAFPGALATTASHIYWTNLTSETIGRANLDGSGVISPFIGAGAPGADPYGLAVDDAHIYWTNEDTGAISRAELDGSQVNLSFVPAAAAMRGLAVGGGGIYWGDSGAGRVGRADVDGTDAQPALVTGLGDVGGVGLALDGAAFGAPGADLGSMPVDAGLSPAADLTLRNTGNTTLDLDAAALTGAQAASFAVVNDGCGGRPLEVAATCTVRVAFQPTAEGPASSTLGVGAAALDAPATATLTGTGVADAIPPAAPPEPAPGAGPGPGPSPATPRSGHLAIGATAPQQRRAAGQAIATVRVGGAGRLTGVARLRAGGRSLPIRVVPAIAQRAGSVPLTLALPAAARREIARRGRASVRLRLELSRAGARAATGERTLRIVAPASRAIPGQWLGRRLGPWRTAPPLSARVQGGLRLVDGAGGRSAVVVR